MENILVQCYLGYLWVKWKMEAKVSVFAAFAVLVCALLSTFLPSVLSLSECTMLNACRAITDEGTINLWPLVSSAKVPRFSHIKEKGDRNNTYSWNPCNPWTANIIALSNYCRDVAVCLSIESSGTVYYAVGKADTARFHPDSSTGHCSVTYTGYILNETTQVIIELNCNEEEEGRIDEFVHTNSQQPTIIKATLHSKYACPIKSLSTGSVLLIIFFSVLGIYVLGGMLFLKVTRGATGKELLPNYSFWSDVFMLIQEGCVCTFDKVRGCIGGKNSSYQSI